MITVPVKVGIVGFGTIAERHLAEIKKLRPSAKILIRTRQNIQKPDLPGTVKFTASLNEIFEFQPNVVMVATPATEHADQIERLARSTDLLIIEKPIAANVADAKKIRLVARKAHCNIRVAYNLRYLEGLNKVKHLLLSKIIGTAHKYNIVVGQDLKSWRPHRDLADSVSAQASKGGGVLRELSHELDLAIHLFGEPNQSVLRRSQAKYVELDVEDTAIIQASHGSGSISGKIELNFTQDVPKRAIFINGECGNIGWDLLTGEITIEINGKKESLFIKGDDLRTTYSRMWADILSNQKTILPKASEAAKIINWIEDMEKHSEMEKVK